MIVATAMLAGIAVVAWCPSGRWRVAHRLGGAPTRVSAGWLAALGVTVGSVAAPLVPAVSGPGLVFVVTVSGVIVFGVRQSRRSRLRALVASRRAEVTEMLGLMAAELRSGVLAQRMLAGLADDFVMILPAARAAALGGDVAAALRDGSMTPGRELLRDLAAAWHVSDRSGAPLATVIDRLEQAARVDRDAAREVESGAAPARATGRLMAGLPAIGLMLGSGMGGDPVEVLTTTWIGVLCLAAGCGLACAGVAWVDHIAAGAGRLA